MLLELGKTLVGPAIKSWQFVRQLEREIVKTGDDPAPLPCPELRGRLWRRTRCTLPAFHPGPHRFGSTSIHDRGSG
jgi:hypothetical protein